MVREEVLPSADALCLRDIVEAAHATARFLEDVDRDSFLGDDLRQSGVLQKLIVIGEAAALPYSQPATGSNAVLSRPVRGPFRIPPR